MGTSLKSKVAIVKTNEYASTFDAILTCFELLEAGTRLKDAQKILIKLNCLQDSPNAATDPEIIRNTILVIQQIKAGQDDYEILVGDSPGLLTKSPQKIFENLGILSVIEETGVSYVEFDGVGPPLHIAIPDGIRLKETKIAPIIEKVDLIINLPRLKTHNLTIYTGCVKNYWGIQPGGIKAQNHLKGTSTESFSQVVTDLYSYLADKPQLCLMGGEGMEGSRGPTSGPMRTLNLLFGGFDPVAVDAVAITVVGHNPLKEVPHIRMCTDRNLGIGSLDNIEIVGTPLSDAKLSQAFKFPSRTLDTAGNLFGPILYWVIKKIPERTLTRLSSLFRPIIDRITKKTPHLIKKTCIKCGNCVKICPAEAISLTPYPKFDYSKCIACFSCIETCPEDALRVRSRGPLGILGF